MAHKSMRNKIAPLKHNRSSTGEEETSSTSESHRNFNTITKKTEYELPKDTASEVSPSRNRFESELTEKQPSVLKHKITPILIVIAVLFLTFALYKTSGLKPTCEAAPKRYVDHQDDEYRHFYMEVRGELDKDTDFREDGEGERCGTFGDWFGDNLYLFPFFFVPWLSILSLLFDDHHVKKIFFIITLIGILIWFTISMTFLVIDQERQPHIFDVVMGFSPIIVSIILVRKYDEDPRTKTAFLILIPAGTFMLDVFNSYYVSLMADMLNENDSRVFLILYPIVLTLTEKAIPTIARGFPGIDRFRDEQLYPFVVVLVAFFESVKCAIAVYTFDENDTWPFIEYIIISISTDIIGRNRLLKRGVYLIYSKIDGQTHEVPSRRRLEQGLQACKFEIEYLPVTFLVFIRITDWVILPIAGNHLNREGEADPDFHLPVWVYCVLILAELCVDITTYLIAKRQNWEDIKSFKVDRWPVSLVAIWYGFSTVMFNILSMSRLFYDYRFET